MAYKWLQQKVQEMRNADDKEYLQRMRRTHHFDSNQLTCNMTVLSMVPTLRESLNRVLSSTDITNRLQNNPPEKLQLWEELKVVSIARGVAGIYGCCLLTLLLRVQLNVVGGYLFLDTVNHKRKDAKNQEENAAEVDKETRVPQSVQERYLSLVRHLLGKGFTDFASFVRNATEKEVQQIPLKEQMSIDYVQTVVNAIRERIECGQTELNHHLPTLPLIQYLLPGEQVPDIEVVKTSDDEMFDRLVKETRDLLESPDFHLVLQESLDRGFSRLMDALADHYHLKMDPEQPQQRIHEVALPFAKVLPVVDVVITRLLCDAPNPFVQELLLLEQMKNLAANIYEAFSQENSYTDAA